MRSHFASISELPIRRRTYLLSILACQAEHVKQVAQNARAKDLRPDVASISELPMRGRAVRAFTVQIFKDRVHKQTLRTEMMFWGTMTVEAQGYTVLPHLTSL